MSSFNVIWHNCNLKRFEAYDVMPFFIDEYNKARDKPKTFEEFSAFIKSNSRWMFWSRCQYEVVICGWPNLDIKEKWDIHRQIMMNIDIITKVLMDEVKHGVKRKKISM